MSDEDSEEVVQEVLLTVCCRGFPEWVQDADSMSMYLFCAVRNRAINLKTRRPEYKRKHVSIEGSQASGDEDAASRRIDPIDDRHGPEQQMELSETKNEMCVLIDKLPEDWRDVLLSKIHLGLTLQQIAEELGLTLGIVIGRYRRAIEWLRKELLRRGFNNKNAL